MVAEKSQSPVNVQTVPFTVLQENDLNTLNDSFCTLNITMF